MFIGYLVAAGGAAPRDAWKCCDCGHVTRDSDQGWAQTRGNEGPLHRDNAGIEAD